MKKRTTNLKRIKANRIIVSILVLTVPLFSLMAQVSHNVSVLNNSFEPSTLTIEVGDTVIWTNSSGFHNVNGAMATYSSNPESFGNSTGTNWTYSHVFTFPGTYDYQCDPHVGFGMVGQIIVTQDNMLTVSFSGMTPHVGQNMWLSVSDKETGMELTRLEKTVEVEFDIIIPGIVTGHSYFIDFFADHNGNGVYDAPPTDHAWRLELDDADGSDTLEFSHNTNFTDIEWKNLLYIQFSGMTPHAGQNMWLSVTDKETGMELIRLEKTVEVEFDIVIPGIETGHSYFVDFFSDHNGNGMYDAPPTDHAWRLELDDVEGSDTLEFSHNTNFTDIEWKNLLYLQFSGMTPHAGQNMWLSVTDKETGMELTRLEKTVEVEFDIVIPGIETGHSYFVDFFSDHNGNGMYDAPPTDHAWRLELDDVEGSDTLEFSHNTNFTDIEWKNLLYIQFSGMTPHAGQNMWLSVTDKETGMELTRLEKTVEVEFDIVIPGIETGHSYIVDFFSDHNGNGMYDAPPTDHAWRLELDDIEGSDTLEFSHNTNFTDIEWKNLLYIQFSGMTPHVGQLLELYLFDTENSVYVDTFTINPISEAEFVVSSNAIMIGGTYNIDFFADLSGNETYDAPPTDHAWRITLENVQGDTTIDFSHNTNFIDIMESGSTSVGSNKHVSEVVMYPNPAKDKISLVGTDIKGNISISIHNLSGQLMYSDRFINIDNRIEIDINELPVGSYFIKLKAGNENSYYKFVKTD